MSCRDGCVHTHRLRGAVFWGTPGAVLLNCGEEGSQTAAFASRRCRSPWVPHTVLYRRRDAFFTPADKAGSCRLYTSMSLPTEPVLAASSIDHRSLPQPPPFALRCCCNPLSVRFRAQQLRVDGQAGRFFRGTSTRWGDRSRRRGGWWCPTRRRGRGDSPPRSPQTCRCAFIFGVPVRRQGPSSLRPPAPLRVYL